MKKRLGTLTIFCLISFFALMACPAARGDSETALVGAISTSLEMVALSATGNQPKQKTCAPYQPGSPPPVSACPQVLAQFSEEDNSDAMSFLGLLRGENVKASCKIAYPKGVTSARDVERLLAGIQPPSSVPMLGTASFRGNLYETCLKNSSIPAADQIRITAEYYNLASRLRVGAAANLESIASIDQLIGRPQVSKAATCGTHGFPETAQWCARLSNCKRNTDQLRKYGQESQKMWPLFSKIEEAYEKEVKANDAAEESNLTSRLNSSNEVIDTPQQARERDRFLTHPYKADRSKERKLAEAMRAFTIEFPWFENEDFNGFAAVGQFETGIKHYFGAVRDKLLADSRKITYASGCLHSLTPRDDCKDAVKDLGKLLPPLPDFALKQGGRTQRASNGGKQAYQNLMDCTYDVRKQKETMNGAATDMWVGVITTGLTCGAGSIGELLFAGEEAALAAGALTTGVLLSTEAAHTAYEISKCKKQFTHFEISGPEATQRLAAGPSCEVDASLDWKEFDQDAYSECVSDVIKKAAIAVGMIGANGLVKIPAVAESKPVQAINHFLDENLKYPVIRNMFRSVFNGCANCRNSMTEIKASMSEIEQALAQDTRVTTSEIKAIETEQSTISKKISELRKARGNDAEMKKLGDELRALGKRKTTLKRAADPALDQAYKKLDAAQEQLERELSASLTKTKDPAMIRTLKWLKSAVKMMGSTEHAMETAEQTFHRKLAINNLIALYEEHAVDEQKRARAQRRSN